MKYDIQSNDPEMLSRAKGIASIFAKNNITINTIGIAFLGSIVRGYFDQDADIDISIFEKDFPGKYETNTLEINGFHVHYFKMQYDYEKQAQWDIGKRWAYSSYETFYDPNNMMKNMINEKVHMSKEEKLKTMMVGITLAEWYFNRLTDLWIKRGNIFSAHYMVNEGVNQFLSSVFAFNNELLPDYKWRMYCLGKLEKIPIDLVIKIEEILTIKVLDIDDLYRRRKCFMELWELFLPKIEAELGMRYDEFRNKV